MRMRLHTITTESISLVLLLYFFGGLVGRGRAELFFEFRDRHDLQQYEQNRVVAAKVNTEYEAEVSKYPTQAFVNCTLFIIIDLFYSLAWILSCIVLIVEK